MQSSHAKYCSPEVSGGQHSRLGRTRRRFHAIERAESGAITDVKKEQAPWRVTPAQCLVSGGGSQDSSTLNQNDDGDINARSRAPRTNRPNLDGTPLGQVPTQQSGIVPPGYPQKLWITSTQVIETVTMRSSFASFDSHAVPNAVLWILVIKTSAPYATESEAAAGRSN